MDVWTQQAYIKASNSGVYNFFGVSMALSADGSTLAVGAEFDGSSAVGIGGDQTDNSGTGFTGTVYTFTRDAMKAWTQQAYVKASNVTAGNDSNSMPLALSGDGNTLACGIIFEESNATGIGGNQADVSAPAAGAVYVY